MMSGKDIWFVGKDNKLHDLDWIHIGKRCIPCNLVLNTVIFWKTKSDRKNTDFSGDESFRDFH